MRRFVFLHIPKSAGAALRMVLFEAFRRQGLPADKICPIRTRRLGEIDINELSTYQVFSGHYYFDQVARIPGPTTVVTLLREPRARLISLYNYQRATRWATIVRVEAEGGDSPRLAKSLALGDYLRRKDFVVQINADNVLTRHLIGARFMSQGGDLTISDDNALNLALANLETLAAVGFVHQVDRFLCRLRRLLALRLPATLPVLNDFDSLPDRSRQHERIAPAAIDADAEAEIERCIRIDRRIYDYALDQYQDAG